MNIFSEAFAQYVRVWMFNTKEVAGDTDVAIIQAKERYNRFLRMLTKQLIDKVSLFSELAKKAEEMSAEAKP